MVIALARDRWVDPPTSWVFILELGVEGTRLFELSEKRSGDDRRSRG